jgi:hypothetical protein
VTETAVEVAEDVEEIPKTESYTVGDFEFTKRSETIAPATEAAVHIKAAAEDEPAPTVAAIEVPKNGDDSVSAQPPVTLSSIGLNEEDEIEIP